MEIRSQYQEYIRRLSQAIDEASKQWLITKDPEFKRQYDLMTNEMKNLKEYIKKREEENV